MGRYHAGDWTSQEPPIDRKKSVSRKHTLSSVVLLILVLSTGRRSSRSRDQGGCQSGGRAGVAASDRCLHRRREPRDLRRHLQPDDLRRELSGAGAGAGHRGIQNLRRTLVGQRWRCVRIQAGNGPKLVSDRAAFKDGAIGVEMKFDDRKGVSAGLIVRVGQARHRRRSVHRLRGLAGRGTPKVAAGATSQ